MKFVSEIEEALKARAQQDADNKRKMSLLKELNILNNAKNSTVLAGLAPD